VPLACGSFRSELRDRAIDLARLGRLGRPQPDPRPRASGRRPVLVIASRGYLEIITTLVVVLPITSVRRVRPNHVLLRGSHGLDRPSWAMTERPRTIARDRISAVAGLVDDATLSDVDVYLRDFLDLK